tara:strand:- start:106 stop:564 length:459 start_codon:yes stop_codon:yes gene_type:complete
MKKKPFNRTATLLGKIFDVKAWFDWGRVKASTVFIKHGFSRLVSNKNQEQQASFEAAKKKWGLSEEELESKQKALYRLSLLMGIFSLLLLAYSFYHFFYGQLLAFSLSLIVTGISLVLTFRYHYWQYLIKQRKLKAPFNEWYNKSVKGDTNE